MPPRTHYFGCIIFQLLQGCCVLAVVFRSEVQTRFHYVCHRVMAGWFNQYGADRGLAELIQRLLARRIITAKSPQEPSNRDPSQLWNTSHCLCFSSVTNIEGHYEPKWPVSAPGPGGHSFFGFLFSVIILLGLILHPHNPTSSQAGRAGTVCLVAPSLSQPTCCFPFCFSPRLN